MEPFGFGVVRWNRGAPALAGEREGGGHPGAGLGSVKGSEWKCARQRVSGLRETGGEGVKNKQMVGKKKREQVEKGAGRKEGTAALGRQEGEGVWKWQVRRPWTGGFVS